jgi:hypothetical protein
MRLTSRALAVPALTLGLVAGAIAPAAATDRTATGPSRSDPPGTAPVWHVVAGNFTGDARDESFRYSYGDNAPDDVLISWSNGGQSGGSITADSYVHAMEGGYQPVAGDFDGDSYDEIFWYAAGSAADALWDFTSFSTHVSTPMTVNGFYGPVAGDFTGDGVDDIFWYGAGAQPDTLWEFNPGGTRTAVSVTVSGYHEPVVASIGKDATDDVLWYDGGEQTSRLWDFTRGTTGYTATTVTTLAGHSPFSLDILGDGARGDDVYWYHPGPGRDETWDYVGGAVRGKYHIPLGGTWFVATGDFFGDGHEDVHLIDMEVGETIRDFAPEGRTMAWHDYHWRNGETPVTSPTRP